MLAAKYRFHGHAALRFVFGQGKTFRSKSLSLRVAHNSRRQVSRVAVVVSKKVIKASPKRNRVRRRIYEALRLQWAHVAPSSDMVISVFDPAFLDMSPEDLAKELQKACEAAGIWLQKPTSTTKDS